MKPQKIDIVTELSQTGRGALRSMPIDSVTDLNTGVVCVNFPLNLTPSRALTPALSINYHANQGNSVFGLGFDLNGVLLISRSTRKGVPRYDTSDTFILSGVGELVKTRVNEEIITYRPRIDTQFSSIEYTPSTKTWLIREINGINHVLGGDAQSRLDAHDGRIFQWWITDSYDACGNRIHYQYDKNNNSFYLKQIKYGNYYDKDEKEAFAFLCQFNYGEESAIEKNTHGDPLWKENKNIRKNIITQYIAGFPITTSLLCQQITLYHLLENKNDLVKYWQFTYNTTPTLSVLGQMQEIACRSHSNGLYITQKLSPIIFNYITLEDSATTVMQPLDLDFPIKLPSFQDGHYQWIDLYKDGLPGILYSDDVSAWYWRSEGHGKFSAPKMLIPYPAVAGFDASLSTSCRIMSLGAERKTAIVVMIEEQAKYYLLDEEKLTEFSGHYEVAFSSEKSFVNFPVAFSDPMNEVIDLNSTGSNDLLVLDTQYPHFFPASNNVDGGYDPPKELDLPYDFPRNKLDPDALVTFADVFGDGLLHRVKVNRDGINIWPNLGNGKFAKRIHWKLPSLPAPFDPTRVFLIDIDGTGACDFVYVHSLKISVFLNHGTGFTVEEKLTLYLPELYTHLDQLLFGDFFGKGVSGVIFIKHDVNGNNYYSGEFTSKKPYLIREMIQSSGLKTTFDYTTSTEIYLEDLKNSKSQTDSYKIRVPFSLSLLKSSVIVDPLTQLITAKQYCYHHGEYNFLERLFYGFAYVEERISDSLGLTPQIQNRLIKSWFHNSALLQAIKAHPFFDTSSFVAQDINEHYYKEDVTSDGKIIDLQCPTPLNREIYFSLHGRFLRQELWNEEVFVAPVSIQLMHYNVRCAQLPQSSQHGVFIVQPRESYQMLYEQKQDEPCVHRELNISSDIYDHVLLKLNIHYGRRSFFTVDNSLVEDLKLDETTINSINPLQALTKALLKKTAYAVATDSHFYFKHLIAEEIVFDLSSSILGVPTQLFSELAAINEIKHLANPIYHSQHYYWNDALSMPAPLYRAGSKALIYYHQQLLGSEEQSQVWYSSLLQTDEAMNTMLTDNGYLNHSSAWWKPETTKFYGNKTQFYQLIATENIPEHKESSNAALFNSTRIERDIYQLAISKITEYLTAEKFFETHIMTDYQSLQSCQIVDHNKNIHLLLRDPCGHVIAITQYGQLQDTWVGNSITQDPSLSLSVSDLSDIAFEFFQKISTASVEEIMANHAVYLGRWLKVYQYNLDQQPRCIFKFEKHAYHAPTLPILNSSSTLSVSVSIHYFDGYNNLSQAKLYTGEEKLEKKWLCSGVTIYNQTSQILQQSLPFYTSSFTYEPIEGKPRLFNQYDAGLKLIQQTLPNDEQQKWIYTSWYNIYYDQNVMKNKKNSDVRLAAATMVQFNDGSGNIIGQLKITSEKEYILTCSMFDALNRAISHKDARLSIPNLQVVYNLLGQVVSHDSVDRGKETYLYNYQDTLTRKHLGNWYHQYNHDSWQRLLFSSIYSATQTPVVIEAWIHGEMQENPENVNACGQIISFSNEDGITQNLIFNLNGQCILSNRTVFLPFMRFDIDRILTRDDGPHTYRKKMDLSVDWYQEAFTFKAEYDATGNLLAECLPDGKICVREYNVLSQLQSIRAGKDIASMSAVASHMTYQEAGFRTQQQLGKGILTTYHYDVITHRLTNIKTTDTKNNLLQNQTYKFDPVGNIINIVSGELYLPISKTSFNRVESYALNYVYDDLYRLRTADGLEMIQKKIQSDAHFIPHKIFSEEPQLAIQAYKQAFIYDRGNNLTHIHHTHADQTFWELDFNIQTLSNQLADLTITKDNTRAALSHQLYDAAGNMKKSDAVTDLSWDHTNQLRQVSTKVVGHDSEDTSIKERYTYRGTAFQDIPFTDIRSIVPYNPGFFNQTPIARPKIDAKPFAEYAERLYKISCFETIEGIEVVEQLFLGEYERKRIFFISKNAENTTTVALIRHTLRIRDEETTLATHHLFELDHDGREAAQPILEGAASFEQWEYHFTDHLHSAVLDLDEQENVLSFEAYQAYGSIAFTITRDIKQLSLKDYHYSSEMYDQVSGLYYYGARYYAPQFGRWLAPDPAGIIDGLNLYRFVDNNPMSFWDAWGFAKKKYVPGPNAQAMMEIVTKQIDKLLKTVQKGSALDKHLTAIKNQVKKPTNSQQITEAIGELAATKFMIKNYPTAKLIDGFSAGVGIDQLWLETSGRYIVVEAKGPGATLGKGKQNINADQMSRPWVEHYLKKTPNALAKLQTGPQGTVCGILLVAGKGKSIIAKQDTMPSDFEKYGQVQPVKAGATSISVKKLLRYAP